MTAQHPGYPDMKGKVALVTGGSSGIGLATAAAFARQGVGVVIASRSKASARTALKALEKLGDVHWMSADVANSRSVAKLVAGVGARFSRLDYAFNNGARAAGLRLWHA